MMANRLPSLSLVMISEHFQVLLNTFEHDPSHLRSQNIRWAERALVTLESIFDSQLVNNVEKWEKTQEALSVLKNSKQMAQQIQSHCDNHRLRMDNLKNDLEHWLVLPQEIREKVQYHFRTLKNLPLRDVDGVIRAYKRFNKLRPMLPYLDNLEHIKNALLLSDHHSVYEQSLRELECKIGDAKQRLKTVTLGFRLACAFSALVIPLPLSLPIALSLWKRKNQIEEQHAQLNEWKRLEQQKYDLSQEGLEVKQDVEKICGPHIENAFQELMVLQEQFSAQDSGGNPLARFFIFMEIYGDNLSSLFGPLPPEPFQCLTWFISHMEGLEKKHGDFVYSEEELIKLSLQKEKVLGGQTEEQIKEHIFYLEQMSQSLFPFPEITTLSFRQDFATTMKSIPKVLNSSKELLATLTRGQTVDEDKWKYCLFAIKGYCNTTYSILSYLLALKNKASILQESL